MQKYFKQFQPLTVITQTQLGIIEIIIITIIIFIYCNWVVTRWQWLLNTNTKHEIGFILLGWLKNTNHIFEHLVHQGTPTILIPFIVIIETIRNLIRPGTDGVSVSLVSINVWWLAGDSLDITCNFLCCNHQVHREFLIILYMCLLGEGEGGTVTFRNSTDHSPRP
jgi:hypothetical protein